MINTRKKLQLKELNILLEKSIIMNNICLKTKNYWIFMKNTNQMPLQLANQNKLKVSEKIAIFEKLYDAFGTLADKIKDLLEVVNTNLYDDIINEYTILIEQCPFESISDNHKKKVINDFVGQNIPKELLK